MDAFSFVFPLFGLLMGRHLVDQIALNPVLAIVGIMGGGE